MNFFENQQSPAQEILYGMKHDPHTANAICRIKIIQCKQWTPMHFSMHYNPDPGRPWNNTAGVFRVETNDHQIRFVRAACICAFAMAEPLAAMGKRCRPVDDHAEPVANRARVVPPPKVVLPPPRVGRARPALATRLGLIVFSRS